MKYCDEPGCQYPVFSKGKCKLHWSKYHNKSIAKMSDKRKKEVSQYVQLRNSFIEQERAKNKGKLVCLFCGEMIHGDPDLHHMIGRDNEKLLQIRFWHLAHRKCHSEWHDKIFEELLWGKEYKERVMRYNLVAHQIIWRFN